MKEHNYALQNADTRPRLQSRTQSYGVTSGTKSILRFRGFGNTFSSIVLRVIVCCLRGVGSMSSSRRIPRFIVLFSSGHRWLFFVASLWAYVVVASFLCLRVVGSFFRPQHYILGQVIDVWGHILYCYSVSLLPFYSVTLLLCTLVILSLCYPVTLFPSYGLLLTEIKQTFSFLRTALGPWRRLSVSMLWQLKPVGFHTFIMIFQKIVNDIQRFTKTEYFAISLSPLQFSNLSKISWHFRIRYFA